MGRPRTNAPADHLSGQRGRSVIVREPDPGACAASSRTGGIIGRGAENVGWLAGAVKYKYTTSVRIIEWTSVPSLRCSGSPWPPHPSWRILRPSRSVGAEHTSRAGPTPRQPAKAASIQSRLLYDSCRTLETPAEARNAIALRARFPARVSPRIQPRNPLALISEGAARRETKETWDTTSPLTSCASRGR
jgi:hypothetical protein